MAEVKHRVVLSNKELTVLRRALQMAMEHWAHLMIEEREKGEDSELLRGAVDECRDFHSLLMDLGGGMCPYLNKDEREYLGLPATDQHE